MKVDSIVDYLKGLKSPVVNIRCYECYRVVIAKLGDKFWAVKNHHCWDKIDEVEILDERYLGGTCGLLVTLGREDEEAEPELDGAVSQLHE